MGATITKQAVSAADAVRDEGYAVVDNGLDDAEFDALQNAAILDRLPHLTTLPSDGSGGAVGMDVGYQQIAEAGSAFVYRHGGLKELALSGMTKTDGEEVERMLRRLEALKKSGGSLGVAILEQLVAVEGISADRAALLEGVKRGLEAGSGGGADGGASISSIAVELQSPTDAEKPVGDEPRLDCSLFTLVGVPAGDTALQLRDRKTGAMIAPAASASVSSSSSSASSSGKWVLVVFTGFLYDLVWGVGDGKLAAPYTVQATAASAPSAQCGAGGAAASTTSLSGSKRPREDSLAQRRVSFVLRLVPAISCSLGGKTCAEAMKCFADTFGAAGKAPSSTDAGKEKEARPIVINVHRADGTVTTVTEYRHATVGALKQSLPHAPGTAGFYRALFLGQEELMDEAPLEAYGIEDGAILHLHDGPIRVTLVASEGFLYGIPIFPKRSAGTLMASLLAQGIALPGAEYLSFNGVSIGKSQPLLALGIGDGSTLDLVSGPQLVRVMPLVGPVTTLNMNPHDYIMDVKQQLQQLYDIPTEKQHFIVGGRWLNNVPHFKLLRDLNLTADSVLQVTDGNIRLTVKLPDGSSATVDVSCSQNLDTLRAQIQQRTGIPAYDQDLRKPSGLAITGGRNTLCEEVPLFYGDTICLHDSPHVVTVESADTGDIWHINVRPEYTFDQLKARIRDVTGIAVCDQYITFNNRVITANMPFVVMRARLEARMAVPFILITGPLKLCVALPGGKLLAINAHEEDTLTDLLTKVEHREGRLPGLRYFVVNGAWLDATEERRDLFALHVSDGAILPLTDGNISLNIKGRRGITFSVTVHCNAALADISKQVQDITGLEPHEQRFKKGAASLIVGRTIRELGLTDGSTVDLDDDLILLCVQGCDGKEFVLRSFSGDSIETVKQRFRRVQAIPWNELSLSFPIRSLQLPERGVPIGSLGIASGTSLRASHGMINIRFQPGPGKASVSLLVSTLHTIKDVIRKLGEQGCTLDDGAFLVADGCALAHCRTLASYGIQAGAVFSAGSDTVTLKVKMPEGIVVDVEAGKGVLVEELKVLIRQKAGLDVDARFSLFSPSLGEYLESGHCVHDYGLNVAPELDLRRVTSLAH